MISSQVEGKKKDARLHTHRRHTECFQKPLFLNLYDTEQSEETWEFRLISSQVEERKKDDSCIHIVGTRSVSKGKPLPAYRR